MGRGTAPDIARTADVGRRRGGGPKHRWAAFLPAALAGALVTGGVACALAPTATGALAAQGMRSVAVGYERLALREGGGTAVEEARAMDAELAGRGCVSVTDDGAPEGYWSWSGIGQDGVLATLSIPRLGLVLPVRAGTSDDVLARGLGHMPGTSLPVGGAGTHCVVAGHTDYRDLELFTHIGELEVGDSVTLSSAAGRLRYTVAQVRVTDPQDSGSLRARPGLDLLTLLTCYPPGVNTHRLLVTCERVEDDGTVGDGSAAAEAGGSGSGAPEAEQRQLPGGHLPGWAVAALCALVALASGVVTTLASAYPAICARRRERGKAPQAQAGELIPCTGTTQAEGRRAGAGRR